MLIKEPLVFVPAQEIWPNSTSYVDNGEKIGYVRGYNVEVKTKDGKIDWMSCVWIRTSIEDYLNDEFTKFWYQDCRVTPTGRISFRGYGVERYDPEERDTLISDICQL